MKWFEHVYRLWEAKEECKRIGNTLWYDKHAENLQELLAMLPHGSGLDGEYKLSVQKEKIVITMQYHAMDENGFYDGWIDFTMTIKPSFFYGYNLKITGNFGKYRVIKDYLYEVYDELFTKDIKALYVIHNHKQLWSNSIGWVEDERLATVFDIDETTKYRPPVGGEWMFLKYAT